MLAVPRRLRPGGHRSHKAPAGCAGSRVRPAQARRTLAPLPRAQPHVGRARARPRPCPQGRARPRPPPAPPPIPDRPSPSVRRRRRSARRPAGPACGSSSSAPGPRRPVLPPPARLGSPPSAPGAPLTAARPAPSWKLVTSSLPAHP